MAAAGPLLPQGVDVGAEIRQAVVAGADGLGFRAVVLVGLVEVRHRRQIATTAQIASATARARMTIVHMPMIGRGCCASGGVMFDAYPGRAAVKVADRRITYT